MVSLYTLFNHPVEYRRPKKFYRVLGEEAPYQKEIDVTSGDILNKASNFLLKPVFDLFSSKKIVFTGRLESARIHVNFAQGTWISPKAARVNSEGNLTYEIPSDAFSGDIHLKRFLSTDGLARNYWHAIRSPDHQTVLASTNNRGPFHRRILLDSYLCAAIDPVSTTNDISIKLPQKYFPPAFIEYCQQKEAFNQLFPNQKVEIDYSEPGCVQIVLKDTTARTKHPKRIEIARKLRRMIDEHLYDWEFHHATTIEPNGKTIHLPFGGRLHKYIDQPRFGRFAKADFANEQELKYLIDRLAKSKITQKYGEASARIVPRSVFYDTSIQYDAVSLQQTEKPKKQLLKTVYAFLYIALVLPVLLGYLFKALTLIRQSKHLRKVAKVQANSAKLNENNYAVRGEHLDNLLLVANPHKSPLLHGYDSDVSNREANESEWCEGPLPTELGSKSKMPNKKLYTPHHRHMMSRRLNENMIDDDERDMLNAKITGLLKSKELQIFDASKICLISVVKKESTDGLLLNHTRSKHSPRLTYDENTRMIIKQELDGILKTLKEDPSLPPQVKKYTEGYVWEQPREDRGFVLVHGKKLKDRAESTSHRYAI
jgi:hypothetical protein